jgi:hypothetical protein
MGLLPAGSFPTERQQIAAYPYPITIDRTTLLRPTYQLWIPGNGDMRAVPKSLVAIAFAAQYSFAVSLETIAGSAAWSGAFTRGIYRDINGIETGTAITSQRQAFSRVLIPPETEDSEFRSSFTRYEFSNIPEGEGANDVIRIWLDPERITYSTIRDEWSIYSLFDCGYDNGEGEGGSASISSGGAEINGLTICGDPWKLTGVGVTSLSGSIAPSGWLS